MKFRRDLIIAVLASFCLTATIFMVFPTRSSAGEYDPWIDNNEDGAINIFDAIGLSNAFGMTGDPTKNVNVMNWPVSTQRLVFYSTADNESVYYNASGFGHIHVTWYTFDLISPESISLQFDALITTPTGGGVVFPVGDIDVTQANRFGTLSFPVATEMFRFTLDFASGTTATILVVFYMTYA